ncbi:MAG TPA: DUF445 domain-containing protein [Mycobacteriales bacterium]|nr:DUF445 domain-containing protein [Mycobacteriales bacterium]
MTADESDDARRLRRAKLRASGLLVVAVVVYAATFSAADGEHGWVGYVRAAAEAGMVGGLADWFAVVALFRHPLGVPIPHTALIPSKKAELGRSLGSFVTDNFLDEDLIRSKIESAQIAQRFGDWLAAPGHLEQAVDRAYDAVIFFVESIEDDDVLALRPVIQRTLADVPYARLLGQAVEKAIAAGQHRPIVDLIIARSHDWLRDNEHTVFELVVGKVPWFLPRKTTARKFFAEAVELAAELRRDPDHSLRHSFDTLLHDLARDLQTKESTQAKIDDLVRRSLDRDEVGAALDRTLCGAVQTLRESLRTGPLADQLRSRVDDVVRRFAEDKGFRADTVTWVEHQLLHAVVTNKHQVVHFIGETVDRWDAADASRRIELQIGPDLQAIRINGTLVGACAGLLIHLVTQLAAQ